MCTTASHHGWVLQGCLPINQKKKTEKTIPNLHKKSGSKCLDSIISWEPPLFFPPVAICMISMEFNQTVNLGHAHLPSSTLHLQIRIIRIIYRCECGSAVQKTPDIYIYSQILPSFHLFKQKHRTQVVIFWSIFALFPHFGPFWGFRGRFRPFKGYFGQLCAEN